MQPISKKEKSWQIYENLLGKNKNFKDISQQTFIQQLKKDVL